MSLTEEAFQEALSNNVRARSRTAKGSSNTGVSGLKLPLLKTGNDMVFQLEMNLKKVGRNAWYLSQSQTSAITPIFLKNLFERWVYILNYQLVDHVGYQDLREKDPYLRFVDKYYRLWPVNYSGENPIPQEIAGRMNAFVAFLSERIRPLSYTYMDKELAKLLAFADRELDFLIHPWLDGCGRFATVLVMWLAARAAETHPLPRFGERTEHYTTIKTEEAHEKYMLECLTRK